MSRKPISNTHILSLACVHEVTRQTGQGLTPVQIWNHLLVVYRREVSASNFIDILNRMEKFYLEEDKTTRRYYPNTRGVQLFEQLKGRIIPPQTYPYSS
jgi:hypothetical protein